LRICSNSAPSKGLSQGHRQQDIAGYQGPSGNNR
jgi:hypothetical protein